MNTKDTTTIPQTVSIFDLIEDWQNEGYGLALLDNETDEVITPYIDPSDYPDLEFNKSGNGAVSINKKYYIQFHSGQLEKTLENPNVKYKE